MVIQELSSSEKEFIAYYQKSTSLNTEIIAFDYKEAQYVFAYLKEELYYEFRDVQEYEFLNFLESNKTSFYDIKILRTFQSQ